MASTSLQVQRLGSGELVKVVYEESTGLALVVALNVASFTTTRAGLDRVLGQWPEMATLAALAIQCLYASVAWRMRKKLTVQLALVFFLCMSTSVFGSAVTFYEQLTAESRVQEEQAAADAHAQAQKDAEAKAKLAYEASVGDYESAVVDAGASYRQRILEAFEATRATLARALLDLEGERRAEKANGRGERKRGCGVVCQGIGDEITNLNGQKSRLVATEQTVLAAVDACNGYAGEEQYACLKTTRGLLPTPIQTVTLDHIDPVLRSEPSLVAATLPSPSDDIASLVERLRSKGLDIHSVIAASAALGLDLLALLAALLLGGASTNDRMFNAARCSIKRLRQSAEKRNSLAADTLAQMGADELEHLALGVYRLDRGGLAKLCRGAREEARQEVTFEADDSSDVAEVLHAAVDYGLARYPEKSAASGCTVTLSVDDVAILRELARDAASYHQHQMSIATILAELFQRLRGKRDGAARH